MPSFAKDFEQIAKFEPATNTFKHYVGNPKFDDFTELEYGVGYQVYCKNPTGATVTIKGKLPTKPLSQSLGVGWHLLPALSLEPRALSQIFGTIDCEQVLGYDTASGSLTTPPEAKPGQAYFVKVRTPSTWTPPLPRDPTTRFVFDGDGGRVKQTTAAGTTTFLGQSYEKDSSGKTTKYVFAGSQRLAAKESTGALRFYHGDHLGSSNVITDSTGAIVELAEHTPYGSLSRREGSANVPHKFTGQRFDASTSLYFYNARYYDPQLGRFIQPDIFVEDVSDPQLLNRYSYARNNPLRFIDPTGHFLNFLIGFLIALAISFTVELAISFFKIEGFWAKSLRFFAAATSAAVGGHIGGLTGKALGQTVAASAYATLVLDTGEGRQLKQSFAEGLQDLGVGRKVAAIIASTVTHAATSSAIFVGMSTISPLPAPGQRPADPFKDAPKEGRGGRPVRYIKEQGKAAIDPLIEAVGEGTAGSAIFEVKDMPLPFLNEVLQTPLRWLGVRHAAFLGPTGQDTAAQSFGWFYAFPGVGVSHQRFFTGVIGQSGFSGVDALIVAGRHGGWTFFLTSAFYGVHGSLGLQGFTQGTAKVIDE